MTSLELMARPSIVCLSSALLLLPAVLPAVLPALFRPLSQRLVSSVAAFQKVMSSYRRGARGLVGLCLLASAPLVLAAPSDAILVESRTVESRTVESRTREPQVEAVGLQAGSMAAATTNAATPQAVRQLPFEAPVEDNLSAIGAEGGGGADKGEIEGIETQYHLQLLEQDVLTLRGLVEELQYQLQRLKKTQDDRYLELDSRFQSLQGQLSSGTLAAEPGSVVVTEGPVVGEIAVPTVTGQSEKALYDTALELIRNRQYDLAATQLQAVIDRYPTGTYAANAYYWLGEVYAAKPEPNYEKARQALSQVIEFFPDHQKVADAAFKLGKVYHLMGDCDKARELLTQVVEQYQGKSVAKLGGSYLRDNMSNCQP
jgi:tol-pal system protein YbgF